METSEHKSPFFVYPALLIRRGFGV